MIYTFKPFSPQKDLTVYNEHCKIVPSGWIMILDYDVLILDPRAFEIAEKAIERHPDTDVFGCYASRIGYNHQRLTTRIEENDSISYHMSIAKTQADMFSNGESVPVQSVAGFFMLFNKEYWNRNHFQRTLLDDQGRLFDRNFCLEASQRGRVKLIKGIYLWHTYRLGKGARDISHLL